MYRMEYFKQIDFEFYKNKNPDLRKMSDEELFQHYKNMGYKEGRWSHRNQSGPNFCVALASWVKETFPYRKVLEIGPGHSPKFPNLNVKYADVFDRHIIDKRGKNLVGGDLDPYAVIEKVPHIDYIIPDTSLCEIDEKFDLVFSSHVLEHQRCIIRHFDEVYNILKPGGLMALIIPDKRYCFDHFIPESRLESLLATYYRKPSNACFESLVHETCLWTHNNPVRHWNGDHGKPGNISKEGIENACKTYEAGESFYGHKWKFYPTIFREMIGKLIQLQFIKLKPIVIYDTLKGQFEFMAIFKKGN